MKRYLPFIVLFTIFSYAQPPIAWQKSFGGADYQYANAIEQTADGGYITVGSSSPYSPEIFLQNYNCYVVKMSSDGTMEWQKSFGGTQRDQAYSVQQTIDGGYIIAGNTYSNSGDVSGNHGSSDFWIVKLDSTGTMQWQKCLGGSSEDIAYAIDKTNDGNYIIAGYSMSNDGDVTGVIGYQNDYKDLGPNYWIVKISPKGTVIWEKSYGGYSDEIATSVHQTSDGGYFVSGSSFSTSLDVSGNHGGYDYWVNKLDNLGNLQWQKCLGGSASDYGGSSIQTSDGGYLVSGVSGSNNGNGSGNHGGGGDFWVVKLNGLGTIEWQKCLGGSGMEAGSQYDFNTSLQETSDGSYILAGYTGSNDGDVSGNRGGGDYWVVKFVRGGAIEWQKCLGGTNNDGANAVKQTTDGGYIITGWSKSNNGDVSGNHGNADFWVVKLASELGVNDFVAENFILYPNPAHNQIQISLQNNTENLNNIVIYDVLGNCVNRIDSVSSNQTPIDVSALSKGVYLMEITTESNQKLTKKLVIE